MSTENIEGSYHSKRALELLIASQNGTVHDKLIARETYFLLTFPIMLEFRGQNSSERYKCIPFIFSLDDKYGDIETRIADHFGMRWSELTVVFEGTEINSATTRHDRRLNPENTPAMLRLLRQRGGVDVLGVEGEMLMQEGVDA